MEREDIFILREALQHIERRCAHGVVVHRDANCRSPEMIIVRGSDGVHRVEDRSVEDCDGPA